MRRVLPFLCALLLSTAVVPAFAQQQRLFAVMANEVVELDPRPASVGAVLRRFPLPADVSGTGAVSFGGGQFLAWTWNGAVVLLNTQSGAVQQFRFPEFDGVSLFEPISIVGTDGNARLLVVGLNASRRRVLLVADARTGSLRFQDLGGAIEVRPMAYAAGSNVLFLSRPVEIIFGQTLPKLIDVIDARTGAILKTLDVSPHIPFRLSANATGTRLFVTHESGTSAYDVVSGALLASNTSTPLLNGGHNGGFTALDEHRNRAVVSLAPGIQDYEAFAGISAFSLSSLQFIGKATVPQLPVPPPNLETKTFSGLTQEIDISGLSATMFALQAVAVRWGKYYSVRTCHESQLIALDAHTGQLRQAVSTTAALGSGACQADLVRITEPAAPGAPTAHVSGHRVTLQWKASLDATGYRVEAGSAPGLSNLATLDVDDPQLVVDGVPSGVYHLRVRARNTIGRSSASQDIRVVVP